MTCVSVSPDKLHLLARRSRFTPKPKALESGPFSTSQRSGQPGQTARLLHRNAPPDPRAHRERAKVIKRYHTASTPWERALAHPSVTAGVKQRLRDQYRTLDPVALLAEIRAAQEELGNRVDRRAGDVRGHQCAGTGNAPQPVQSSAPNTFAFARPPSSLSWNGSNFPICTTQRIEIAAPAKPPGPPWRKSIIRRFSRDDVAGRNR
jgi:hypothetical protein